MSETIRCACGEDHEVERVAGGIPLIRCPLVPDNLVFLMDSERTLFTGYDDG